MRVLSFMLAGACALGPSGCGALPEPLLCGEIPDGGCPSGRGGTCDDAACARLYDCVDGAWTVVARCDPPPSEGTDAGAGEPDAACTPVRIDRAGEAAGCKPAVQHPDCPVEAAEACAEVACSTGCVDFFLCTSDGWTGVAYCTEQGQLVVSP